MVKVNIPKADKATRIALQKLSARIFNGLTPNQLLYLSDSGVVASLGAATNGQLPIGNTGNAPTLSTLTGTANQITITNDAGSITLSTPQDIATSSSPTFAGLDLTYTEPYITTHNLTHEDTAGGRESRWIARGEQSGGEETILGYWEFSHSGTSDDEKGQSRLYLNDGNDGTSPTLAITVGPDGAAAFVGAVTGANLNVSNWNTAYTHSQLTSGNPHSVTSTELGLIIGTDVLAYDAGLQNLAGIAMAADKFYYTSADNTHVAGDVTAFARSILDDADEATFKATVNLEIGTDVLAQQTIGIADDNLVEMDDADAADNDYAKFTVNGLEGRSYTEVKQDLSLDSVENTALSTWAGTSNITTLGTIGTGVWNGTSIGTGYTDAKCVTTWPDTYTADQNLLQASSPTFAGLSLGTGELTCGSINRASGTLTLEIGGTAQQSISSGHIELANGLTFGQTSGPLFTFNDNSNYLGITGCAIGIGTVTPSALFHFYKSSSSGSPDINTSFCIESTNTAYFEFLTSDGYNGQNGLLFSDAVGIAGRLVYNHHLNIMYFYTAGSKRMTIDNTGTVDMLENCDVVGNLTAGTIRADNGYTGSYTNGDGDTVTVVGGLTTGVS